MVNTYGSVRGIANDLGIERFQGNKPEELGNGSVVGDDPKKFESNSTKRSFCILLLMLLLSLIVFFQFRSSEKRHQHGDDLSIEIRSSGQRRQRGDDLSKEFRSSGNGDVHVDAVLASHERGTGGLCDADRSVLAVLYSAARRVFEYGLGESTKLAAEMGVPRYHGVDSDAAWVSNVQSEAPKTGYNFTFQNIGPTREWGNPVNCTPRPSFETYSKTPFETGAQSYDMYFIDGRFRVACTAQAFLHASSGGSDNDAPVVVVHDFGPPQNRRLDEYKDILTIADIVGGCCLDSPANSTVRIGSNNVETSSVTNSAAALVVLKRKPSVTDKDIESVYNQYKYDCA